MMLVLMPSSTETITAASSLQRLQRGAFVLAL